MTAARLGMSMTLAGLEPASFASEGDASLITPWGLVKPKPLKTRVEHMRTPGVEPGPQAWEACMMPLHYVRQCQCSSTQLCIYIYIYIYTYTYMYVYTYMCVSGEPLHRRRVGHSNRTRPRAGVTGSGLETTRTGNSLDNDLRFKCVVFVSTLALSFVFGFILSFMCLFVVSFSGLKFVFGNHSRV